jgi:hypothetical protein
VPNNVLEWSRGKPRPIIRLNEGTALEPVESVPMNDPKTGRFVPNNRAYRRRQIKERQRGLATMNPATVPTWLRPFVEQGAPYVRDLLALLAGRPELHPLAGDAADAHVVYLGLRTLALQSEDPKERASLLSEARGWLREHRSSLATLCALAGDIKLPEPADPLAPYRNPGGT